MKLTVPSPALDHPQHVESGSRVTAAGRDPVPPPTSVPSPSARISCRPLGHGTKVLFTVAGAVGAHDAAILSRCLHARLDDHAAAGAGTESAVIVVDLTEVESYGSGLVDLLVVAEQRARTLAVGLHVLDLGRSGLLERWQTRHGHGSEQSDRADDRQ